MILWCGETSTYALGNQTDIRAIVYKVSSYIREASMLNREMALELSSICVGLYVSAMNKARSKSGLERSEATDCYKTS